MEFINSFFGLICSFFGDIIYKKTIMNSLISFKTNEKTISNKKRDISIFKIVEHENNKKKIRKKKTNCSRTSKKLKNINDLEDKKSENHFLSKNNCESKNQIEIKDINPIKESFNDNNKKKNRVFIEFK